LVLPDFRRSLGFEEGPNMKIKTKVKAGPVKDGIDVN
jgi:hypothetical protein